MQVADKSVVSIHYTLTNSAGETLDSSVGQAPLAYLHGASNIVPGLENALVGKAVGDKLDVQVTAEEGYGPLREELVQKVPHENFQGVEDLQVGMQFMAQAPWGEQPVTVVKVEEDGVTLDGNHPLAGQDLTFAVEIVEIRDATEEEMTHGHAHGEGGHHH
ncbi:peptidylprolyl isomerase [Neptunomonas phycophila]|jgi:FKBP-type peptidyl-prolyl cis-trans isomerase SlyD|uniref:Peptidyl-prolyl cis-trans isomerase n=1 Tax=Neptunomonas phycophila TaxID=1572645 RepID=A0AAW7XEE0_9GAMM|nr:MULTISPECIES: peptidylprolyl isomerase [Neptunomonas]MBT3146766.1 peptidylprolyl isomerase [Neptunomonas phycophila]MDN2661502.1 peptidylprolyl isomerase [Neptunomonas sp. CHC150]MDO6452556.1 peptidylprolyl isomerase [Neptunomonas phycophila]MDO6467790.1 peptidylprolyl isomerase [Neptunomonas phycophila]MDO6783781.1 peptidylprolyl isomerase [Neptunomonas phycophila]